MLSKKISEDIDVVRGVAALGVIVAHSLYLNMDTLNGAFWVWVFFVLSGFLQGALFFQGNYQLNLKGNLQYYKNRSLRIFPLLWLVLLIAFLFNVNGSIDNVSLASIFNNFFTCSYDNKLVGPMWTISVEIHFYFFVPFLLVLISSINKNLRRFGFVKNDDCVYNKVIQVFVASVLFLGVLLFSRYCLRIFDDNLAQPRFFISNLYILFFGLLVSQFTVFHFRVNVFVKYLLMTVIIVYALYLNVHQPSLFWNHSYGIFCAISLGFITLVFERKTSYNPQNFIIKFFKYCGKYCYGIYAYAALLGTLYKLFGGTPGYRYFLISMTSIIIAPISYTYFEKKILKFKE